MLQNHENPFCFCIYQLFSFFLFFFFFFSFLKIYFGCTVQLSGSQFPNQGLNLGHGSERAES